MIKIYTFEKSWYVIADEELFYFPLVCQWSEQSDSAGSGQTTKKDLL